MNRTAQERASNFLDDTIRRILDVRLTDILDSPVGQIASGATLGGIGTYGLGSAINVITPEMDDIPTDLPIEALTNIGIGAGMMGYPRLFRNQRAR